MSRVLALLAIASLCLATAPHLTAKQKKPQKGNNIETLLRPPRVFNMTMSPDGKYAASVAPIGDNGDRGIAIFDLETMKIHRSFKWKARDIDSVTWTTNEDVAFHLSKWDAFVEGVYSVNVNRSSIYPLISNDAVVQFIDSAYEEPFSWLWIRDGHRVKSGLVRLNDTGTAEVRHAPGDYRIADTNSNPLLSDRIASPPGQVYAWYVDQNHVPRIVLRFLDDKLEYLHRSNDSQDWQTLPLDPELWDIQLFGADANELYIAGYNGANTKGLFRYDIESGEVGELLFRDDYYDFSDSVSYLYFKKQVVGFSYMRATPSFVWLHQELEGVQKLIDSVLKDRINVIYDSSGDCNRHLVYSYSDKSPPEYLVLDLKKKSLREITKTAPWLSYEALAKTEVFHFETSDGLKLEGYLTRPPGKEAPYPTVCLVHGGPWVRDTGGYDDETQLLAHQGFAVLRVNYRGSTGYGKKLSFDPQYDFRKMQDDITEAVQMAVKHGIADPDRLAIMGASFGGYSALCGAAFEPDLYQCAITNMGVFDWEEMVKDRKRQKAKYSYHKLVEKFGDPKKDKDKFEEISPIHHVDKIKIPIFIIHGKEDSNVSIRQSKMLKSELAQNGVPHETLFVGGEGHNIFELKKRIDTYERVIAFLNEHLK